MKWEFSTPIITVLLFGIFLLFASSTIIPPQSTTAAPTIFDDIKTYTPTDILAFTSQCRQIGLISTTTLTSEVESQYTLQQLLQTQQYYHTVVNSPQSSEALTFEQINSMFENLSKLPILYLLQNGLTLPNTIIPPSSSSPSSPPASSSLPLSYYTNQYFITLSTLYNILKYNTPSMPSTSTSAASTKQDNNNNNNNNNPIHEYKHILNKFNKFFEYYYSLYPDDIDGSQTSFDSSTPQSQPSSASTSIPYNHDIKTLFYINEKALISFLTPLLDLYITNPVASTLETSSSLKSILSQTPATITNTETNNNHDLIESIILMIIENYPFLTPTIIKLTQYLSNEPTKIGDIIKIYNERIFHNSNNENDGDILDHFFRNYFIYILRLKITTVISNHYKDILDISTSSSGSGSSNSPMTSSSLSSNQKLYTIIKKYKIVDKTLDVNVINYYCNFLHFHDELLLTLQPPPDSSSSSSPLSQQALNDYQHKQHYVIILYLLQTLSQLSQKHLHSQLLPLFHSYSTSPYEYVNYYSINGINNIATISTIPISLHHPTIAPKISRTSNDSSSDDDDHHQHHDKNDNHHQHHDKNDNHHHHDHHDNHTNNNDDHHNNHHHSVFVSSISGAELLNYVPPQSSAISLKVLKQLSSFHHNDDLRRHSNNLFSTLIVSIREGLNYWHKSILDKGYKIFESNESINNNDNDDDNNNDQQHANNNTNNNNSTHHHQHKRKKLSHTKELLVDLMNRYNIYYKYSHSPRHRNRILRDYNAAVARISAEGESSLIPAASTTTQFIDLNDVLLGFKKAKHHHQ